MLSWEFGGDTSKLFNGVSSCCSLFLISDSRGVAGSESMRSNWISVSSTSDKDMGGREGS